MKVTEEKEYIFEMMRDISAERRKLTDIYYGLKERMDYLNSLEQQGIETLSLKGYADLHNETQKQIAVTNIKRETEHLIKEIENDNIIEESRPVVEIKKQVELIRDKTARKRRGSYSKISKDKQKTTVINILKDAGAPLKLQDIFDKAKLILDTDLSYASFQNNIMKELVDNNPKVNKPMKGFYQYTL